MPVDDRIPFIRILNASQHKGDELWVLASVVRLLNVIRVWVYEVEVILAESDKHPGGAKNDLEFFDHSAHHLIQLIKQAYVVLRATELRPELAYFEEELFKFETLYLTTNLCLIINEESVEFHQDRYKFLCHSLYGVLHDLNQPLSAMISMVAVVESGDETENRDFHADAKEVITQCKSQLGRGFELIKGSFAVEELSINQMVDISRDSLETLLKAEQIKLVIDQKLHQGAVMYSRTWYKGLLANIVDNAKKSFWIKGEHLGHGDFERTLFLTFTQDTLPGDHPALAIIISDTGIGFSSDVLAQGFIEGHSGWGDERLVGQGVGMAAHVEYINKLRGQIVLANLNQQGQIDGAQMIIKLPLIETRE